MTNKQDIAEAEEQILFLENTIQNLSGRIKILEEHKDAIVGFQIMSAGQFNEKRVIALTGSGTLRDFRYNDATFEWTEGRLKDLFNNKNGEA